MESCGFCAEPELVVFAVVLVEAEPLAVPEAAAAVVAADMILLAVFARAVLPLFNILVPLVSAAPGVIASECEGMLIVGAGAFVGAIMLKVPGKGDDT